MFKFHGEVKTTRRVDGHPSETISSSKNITNDERRKSRQPLTLKLKLMLVLFLGVVLSGVIAYATRDPLAVTAVNGLIIIAGLWMFISVMRRMGRSLSSYRWEPCEYSVSDTYFTMKMGRGEYGFTKYIPHYRLNYTYQYRDYSVTSEDELNQHVKYVFATPHHARQYLSQLVEDAQAGKIYVNPDKPEEAFLRRGINRDEVGLLFFSLMLIILPILTMMGIIVWRSGTV